MTITARLTARGNERAWWRQTGIDPIKVAGKLWRETRATKRQKRVEGTAKSCSKRLRRGMVKRSIQSTPMPRNKPSGECNCANVWTGPSSIAVARKSPPAFRLIDKPFQIPPRMSRAQCSTFIR
jgi:hypothetical protein